MTKLAFGNAVLCDYVAKGAGLRHTLVNVYHGDIVCQEIPGHLQIGLFLEILPPSPKSIKLEVLVGDIIAVSADATIEIDDNEVSIAVLPQFLVELRADCEIVVKVTPAGGKPKIALSKKIYKGPPERFALLQQ